MTAAAARDTVLEGMGANAESGRRRVVSTVCISAVGLLAPSAAHASDMGLVIPVLFIPINIVAALLMVAISLAGRSGRPRRRRSVTLWILTVLLGLPNLLSGTVSYDYVARGRDYVETATWCLASSVLFLLGVVAAHWLNRRGDGAG